MTATLKYALSSDKKMELVAKLVRGKDVNTAISILTFTPKKAAKILLKVIKSAYYNAKYKTPNLDGASLIVSKIDLWKWPTIKRMKFVWRSRIHGLIKYRTFIKVVLDNK